MCVCVCLGLANQPQGKQPEKSCQLALVRPSRRCCPAAESQTLSDCQQETFLCKLSFFGCSVLACGLPRSHSRKSSTLSDNRFQNQNELNHGRFPTCHCGRGSCEMLVCTTTAHKTSVAPHCAGTASRRNGLHAKELLAQLACDVS